MDRYRTRTHDVHLRLDDVEYAALMKNSKKCCLSQQAYIRKLIALVRPNEHPPADFFKVWGEIHKIGINLNQISAKANALDVIDKEMYEENCRQLRAYCAEVVHNFIITKEEKLQWSEKEMKFITLQ